MELHMYLDKLKTVGVIIILGVILSTLGVLSVVFMPFYWMWTKVEDYSNRKEVDVPNYLSGKSSKDKD